MLVIYEHIYVCVCMECGCTDPGEDGVLGDKPMLVPLYNTEDGGNTVCADGRCVNLHIIKESGEGMSGS
jgi:hypothetical protein